MIQFRVMTAASLVALLNSPLFDSAALAADKVVMQIDGAAVPFYAPLYAGVEKGSSKRTASRSSSSMPAPRTF
uniref:hypothetical protein n=1 Tax=Neorhizobium sp. EC2-8 TaxID=3129230 RepID=UPI003101AB15